MMMKCMLVLAFACMLAAPAAAFDGRVYDGDTLIRSDGQRLRLLDIDTPELSRPRCAREKALGLASKARLVGFMARGVVVIEYSGKHDYYGRPLIRVKVNGKDAGAVLLAEGHALPYRPGREAKAWRMRQWCPNG